MAVERDRQVPREKARGPLPERRSGAGGARGRPGVGIDGAGRGAHARATGAALGGHALPHRAARVVGRGRPGRARRRRRRAPRRLSRIRGCLRPQHARRAGRDPAGRRPVGHGRAGRHRPALGPPRARRGARLATAPARQPAPGRAHGGVARALRADPGTPRRTSHRRGGKPGLFRAPHHQHQRVGHHPRSELGDRRRGTLRLPRPPRRRPCAYRLLPAVPQLRRRRLQQRPSLHRAARGPGGLRGARDPAGRGRGARILVPAPDAQLVTRARGALLGLVVGNQLGVPTERFGSAEAIRAAFPQGVRDLQPPPKGSPFDDDAAMTLLLAESLAERGDLDAGDVAARWVKWMKVDGRGVGLTTQRALRLIERGVEPFEAGRQARSAGASASNGAVMRCIPVALRYHDNVDKLIRVSTQQAAITHADERCTWGAAAVNLAARELLHGNQYFVEEVLHRLQGAAPRVLIEAIRRVPWEQESDLPVAVPNEFGYAVHCVEVAFWCAVHRPSLEEALVFLVEAGGDTDTNAAVAGALLGARDGETGIPPRWLDQLGRASTRGVSELAERLVRMS
ncbi:MAG: hypothetical protein DMD73_07820 [Gemmatimonadetes bacterium]|nr:MAG: hypothetical protein DMD73_07820 [Gemmatimonadota bacterium]